MTYDELMKTFNEYEYVSVHGFTWKIKDVFPEDKHTRMIKRVSFKMVLNYIEKEHYGLPLYLSFSKHAVRIGIDNVSIVIRYNEHGREIYKYHTSNDTDITKTEENAIKKLKLFTII